MAPRPTLVRERAVWADEQLLVGVDEAGRGPLAGPVVAAAVVFPRGCSAVRGLRDSKILPASVRARLAECIRRRAIARLIRQSSLAPYPLNQDRRASYEGRLTYHIIIDGLPLPEIGYAHDA